MSTVDTHLNWGGSYLVNDVLLRIAPFASDESQLRLARAAVLGFVMLAVGVSFHIDTIEQAWKWVAALGAALGIPTALRWIWWRVNAAGELTAMAFGLGAAAVLALATDLPYELRLIGTSAASAIGLLLGVALGPPTAAHQIRAFAEKVRPLGFWPRRQSSDAAREMFAVVVAWSGLMLGVVGLMFALHRLLFLGQIGAASGFAAGGVALIACVMYFGEEMR
jgi:solute:Na+ symporter, SSS family